jgi:hypothetical protein
MPPQNNMNYRESLHTHLLSENNVGFLVSTFLKNFKLSRSTTGKCISTIKEYLSDYLTKIDRYPVNQNEWLDAVRFLNNKCYDDFYIYLRNKYPNVPLLRDGAIMPSMLRNEQQIPVRQEQQIPVRQEQQIPVRQEQQISVRQEQQIPVRQEQQIPDSLILSPDPPQVIQEDVGDRIIIITKQERDELLEANGLLNKSNISNNFLEYLTDDTVLSSLKTMLDNINAVNISQENVYDEVLTVDEFISMLSSKKRESDKVDDTTNIIHTNIIHTNEVVNTTNIINTKVEPNIIPDKVIKTTEQPVKQIVDTPDIPILDISKGITKETMGMMNTHLKKLLDLKNEYRKEGLHDKVEALDVEKDKLVNALKEYKKTIEEDESNTKDKIQKFEMKKTHSADNVDILDLSFDPTHNYNDLKDIVIKFKRGDTVSDISLLSYKVLKNENNVTRFNNNLMIFFNEKMRKICIPPGKYDIDTLLEYIKGEVTFIDISRDEHGIITISNKMNMKFDLIVSDDTIYPLLGFSGGQKKYKDKLFYTGSDKYDMLINDKVYFSLSGSTTAPISLEFDKKITTDISLKTSKSGMALRQIMLKFVNDKEQLYDFTMPFEMCLKVTYTIPE